MDGGEILIWNPGPGACRVRGRVAFAAYDTDGSRTGNAVAARSAPASVSITLPRGMAAPRGGDPTRYLSAIMIGAERDDPAGPRGLCRRRDEVTPATLALSLGAITIRVTNYDSGDAQVRAIYGCHGRVLLASVRGPSA